MNYLVQFSALVMANLQYVLLAMTAMIFLALIIFIHINIKLSRMNRRYRKMMQGMEGANLERLLTDHIEEVRQAMVKIDSAAAAYNAIVKTLQHCVQKMGIVRFNAFEDTGSDLSYAIALLDSADNGIVLSSIFGRNESRSYAKPVINGQSSYFLTEEEKQALQQAMGKKSFS
ncbi:MAG: DUF4446 family protein [Veillonellales bacterium]